IVLMPRPCATDLCILHNHFRVIMINLVVEKLLDGIHELATTREHSVNAFAGMIPKREPHLRAAAVVLAEGMLVERAIFLGRLAEKPDLFLVEKFSRDDESILMVGGDLFWSQFSFAHGCYGWWLKKKMHVRFKFSWLDCRKHRTVER